VTGAYILSSGFDKVQAGDEHAKGLHGFASGAYPALEKVNPKVFTRAVGVAEMTLGAALLLPVVPPLAAGAGLVAFSGGLLGIYWRTPGMHRSSTDPRPTQDGMVIAKDSWMLGIGAGLITDSLLSGAHDKRIAAQKEMSKVVEVRKERARGRSREARLRARELRAEARLARSRAKAATAGPRVRAGMITGRATGRAKGMSDATKGITEATKGFADVTKSVAGTTARGATDSSKVVARGATDASKVIADAAKTATTAAREATHRVAEHINS
jgi:uncharacterized membrane protein YphA (DoxX/SURF4 family)